MALHKSAHQNAPNAGCNRAPVRSSRENAGSFALLVTAPASGAWNMAVDETLLEAAATEELCALRFYQWEEPTLSLGYFQTYDDRRQHAASEKCPVVRRASGGGAILHDIELTYSLAVPDRHPLAVDRLRTYRTVHQTLLDVLADWGVAGSLWGDGRPAGCGCADRANSDKMQRQAFLCFQRRSPGDVIVGGVKVAGSAQRRRQGAVLQHGSVLLARSAAAPELDGLRERTGRFIRVAELTEAWSRRLAAALSIEWYDTTLNETQQRRAAEIANEKYATAAWTQKRF